MDESFPANDKSIGQKILAKYGGKVGWKRPAPGSSVKKDTFSPMDVTQGKVGDCYLMSAMSVLGDEYLNKILFMDPKENEGVLQAPETGAFIVKFFINYSPYYMIIDDQFPVNDDGDWLFGHADDKLELWPNILEKAYSKLHGSYENIVSG